MSSINPINTSIPLSDYSSLLGSSGDSTSFDSIFTQAMSQATTPAQSAQIAMDETQYDDVNTLYSMADGSSDSSGIGGLGSLLGTDGLFNTPAWETDLANLLGPNSAAAQALSLGQQASVASQSLLNGDLNSLGSDVNSLI